jgi:integrase/recombinase XerD
MKPLFKSRWREELNEFLKFRQTNFTSAWPERKLRRFDQYAAAHPRLAFRGAVTAWLKRDANRHPLTNGSDLIAIRQFCLYRRRFAPSGFVPELLAPGPSARSHFKACILSRPQIKVLLQNIAKLSGPPLRRARMRALFLVLYCTGLRIGEALQLRLVDVDLHEARFRVGPSKGRIRWVPFGRDLARQLRHWLDCRRRAGFKLTPQTPLFEREDGRRDNLWNASMRFNTLFRRCGLKPKRGTGRGGLRVHDLRHTFAVHRLERWYREGHDPGLLLPWLSAYLGHVNLLGTERYLQATQQTLVTASRRFRRSLGFNPAMP